MFEKDRTKNNLFFLLFSDFSTLSSTFHSSLFYYTMSSVPTKQYLMIRHDTPEKGNITWLAYYEHHQTLISLLQAALAMFVYESSRECRFQLEDGTVLDSTKTFEEVGITETGKVIVFVTKDANNEDWAIHPLHNPEPAPVDRNALECIKQQQAAKKPELFPKMDPSAPCSSTQ